MADIQTKLCLQCAAPYLGRKTQKYCSTECKERGRPKRKRSKATELSLPERLRLRRAAAMRTCGQCGDSFLPSGGGPNIYCSTACRGDAQRLYASKAEAKSAQYRRAAERRGVVPMARRSVIAALKRRVAALEAEGRCCGQCGCRLPEERKGYRGAPSICTTCAEGNARAAKRKCRLARKALKRTKTVERFDPIEVLERDGWRCHLCGVKTPKKLRGTYADQAPELDHIIPLSQGGEHSRRNTACSCRKCNIEKADKPLGQMLLIA